MADKERMGKEKCNAPLSFRGLVITANDNDEEEEEEEEEKKERDKEGVGGKTHRET